MQDEKKAIYLQGKNKIRDTHFLKILMMNTMTAQEKMQLMKQRLMNFMEETPFEELMKGIEEVKKEYKESNSPYMEDYFAEYIEENGKYEEILVPSKVNIYTIKEDSKASSTLNKLYIIRDNELLTNTPHGLISAA